MERPLTVGGLPKRSSILRVVSFQKDAVLCVPKIALEEGFVMEGRVNDLTPTDPPPFDAAQIHAKHVPDRDDLGDNGEASGNSKTTL